MVFDVNVLTTGWTIAGVLVSLLVAAIALCLGLYSHWQYRHSRGVEKKEDCIKEINDWASNVMEYTAGQTSLTTKQIIEVWLSDIGQEEVVKMVAYGENVRLNRLSAKSIYLKSLELLLFPGNTALSTALDNVILRISQQLKYLDLVKKGKVINTGKASQISLGRMQEDAMHLIVTVAAIYAEIK